MAQSVTPSEVFVGRPNTDGRLDKEIRVYDLLDKVGAEYIGVDHLPLVSVDESEAIESRLSVEVCKNLFLCNRQKTQFYMLTMPGEKHFVTKDFSKKMGCSRLSFAPEEAMLSLLDTTPGSVSILGLMNDKENRVQLVFDSDLLKKEYIGCHPCINTSSLKLKTKEVLEKILPAMGHNFLTVEL